MANGGKTEEEKMVKCFKIEFLIIKSLRFSRGAFSIFEGGWDKEICVIIGGIRKISIFSARIRLGPCEA